MTEDADILVPYRLRTVRLGIQATWLVIAALLIVAVLPNGRKIPMGPYLGVLAAAAAGVLLVVALPWERLFRGPAGMRAMYAWSVMDIVLITVMLGVVGPEELDVFLLYALTTLVFAASYPPRGQLVLLGFTYACYLTLLATRGWDLPAGSLGMRFATLGVMTFLASFLSRELMRQIAAHREASAESEQRARLLGAVAGAARGISTLDRDRVLAAVVDSALALGFEAGNLSFYDPTTHTFHLAHARGIPESFAQARHSASTGMVGLVLSARDTVVIGDYAQSPHAVPIMREAGFQAVIAAPVWSGGKLAAVLVAGTRDRRSISGEEREAFELIAAQAGRALENAERFEDERRTVERLAELDRLKRDFLTTVSHEIRTPLTVIEGMGMTLEDRWDSIDDRTRREFVQSMNANSKALEEIITSLLDFSRLETGRLEAHPQRFPVSQLVDQVVARLDDLLSEHLVFVEVQPGVEAMGDPMLVERVIENLVTNAAKHTQGGTGILVTVEAVPPAAVFAVADDGPGIAPEDLAHIRERFYRGGDPNNRTQGIGLGLALAREILELHGSQLEVESQLGRGSAFSFRLPLVLAPSHAPAEKTSR